MSEDNKQPNTEAMQYDTVLSTGEKNKVLANFMKEFFPFTELKKAGFFTKEMKGNYQAQADKVCKFFGFKTVYEYGAMEIRAHLSYTGKRPKEEPFVTEITNINKD